jgi:putative acetyltransferase
MPQIAPIQPGQVAEARRLIYTVAHPLFHPDRPFAEVVADWDAQGVLADLEDVRRAYFDSGGTFLVMTQAGRVIGTGALQRLAEEVAELKRLWLLPEYQGQGLGYRMVMQLFRIARQKGYRIIRLETDPIHQTRAVAFYRRLGFHEIPRYGSEPDAIALEIALDP